MSGKKKLHPTVIEFKEFVQGQPKIIQVVRSGEKTWQELYQDWYLLGENAEIWNEYKDKPTEKVNSKMLGKVMNFFQNIDREQLEGQLNNLQNIAANIQEIIGIFQGKSANEPAEQSNPFMFQKD